MNEKCRRRSLLAGAGTATAAALAGCLGSIPGLGGGEGGPGTIGTEDWPMPRGGPGNRGWSASGGPGGDASTAVTAALRDGIRPEQWTAPTVGSDGIYAVGNEREPYDVQPPRFRLYVYRLSRTDGTETWRRILRERQDGGATGAVREYGGPAVSGEDVFVTWIEGERYDLHVASLSAADGTTNWSRTVTEGAAHTWSPVVHDGTLYCVDGRGAVLALSAADGSELWRSPEVYASQRFPSVGERGVAVYNLGQNGETDGRLTLYDREDGSERWTKSFTEGRLPSPTVDGDTVFVAEGGSLGQYGLGYEVPPREIRAFAVEDGNERWSHTYDTEAIREAVTPGGTATVTVDADHVYYALGFPSTRELLGQDPSQENLERVRSNQYEGPNVVALDRSDGSVVWETQVGTIAHVFRPMAVGPDHLYALYRGIQEEDGDRNRIYVLDRNSGEVLGRIGPTEEDRPFAVVDGTLFTHTGSRIRGWE